MILHLACERFDTRIRMPPHIKLTARKSIIALWFVAMILESLWAPRGSSPGRSGAFILAWAMGTRQFLRTPSKTLVAFCSFCAITCVALSRRISTDAHYWEWQVLCLFCGVLILWWERMTLAFERLRGLKDDS
jgi:hypothetical protein